MISGNRAQKRFGHVITIAELRLKYADRWMDRQIFQNIIFQPNKEHKVFKTAQSVFMLLTGW